MANRRPLVNVAGDLKELPVGDLVPVSALGSGTPDGTKFLRDDGTFAVPAGGGGGSLRIYDPASATLTTAATSIAFLGDGLTAWNFGSDVMVQVDALVVKDEGTNLTTKAASLNFTGSGVTSSTTGNNVTVDVPGLRVYDDSVTLTTNATSLNIMGTGVTAWNSGSDVMLQVDALVVKDEGTNLTTQAASLNFTGAGVTASNTGGAVTINVPGGGGSSIEILDEGVSKTTAATSIDFVGTNARVLNTGGAVQLIVDTPPIKHLGTTVSGFYTSINVTGGGAFVFNNAQEAEINVPGLIVKDEYSPLANVATSLNFVGAGVTASGTSNDKIITIPGGGSLTVKDEGVDLTTAATSVNFTGAGVTATNTGGAVTVTIAGGGGSATPAGVDTQLQYNNAGAFGGVANIEVMSGDLSYITHAAPAAPSYGRATQYARSLGGRVLTAAITRDATEHIYAPALFRKKMAWWNPPGNGTGVPGIVGMAAPTAVGTATARNVATTNLLTRSRRLAYVSAATAAALTGHYVAAAQYTTGNGSGLGGFFYSCRFAFSDAAAVAGARAFVGLSSGVAAPTNVEPNTLANAFGIAQLSTDSTQLYLINSGNTTQAAIPLGTNFPPMAAAGATNGVLYQLTLFSPTNANGTITVLLERLGTAFEYNGSFTAGAGVPASTILLAHRAWRCNNATALAVGIDVGDVYVETDY
jgi:hypothetical protein